jgi:hypothetical protein
MSEDFVGCWLELIYSVDLPCCLHGGKIGKCITDLIGQSSTVESNAYTGSYRQTSTDSESIAFLEGLFIRTKA